MNGWRQSRLQDICLNEKSSIISGPFGSNISSKFFVSDGVPVIRGNNLSLSLDKFYDEGFVFVSEQKAEELNCYALEGDLVFTAAGTIGQVGILEAPLKYDKYVISNKQLRARLDTSKVDTLYAYYWYSSPWMQSYFLRNNKGSTVPLISLSELKDAPIYYPESLVEQKKIVRILDDITKKIENNNALAAVLESMAKLLYDYWFVQFDFPDEDDRPYKSSGGKMVWNEDLKREIPDGWEAARLGDHISTNRGISYNSSTLAGDGIPMINLASFNIDSTYKVSGLKTYSGAYGKEQVLKPYDLVMCNTQQTAIDPEKDIIGKTLLVPDIFDGDIVSSHHVTTIRTDDAALKYYLNAESKTEWFHKYVAGFASGTNILGLDFNGVLNYRMPIPPQGLLTNFAELVHNYEAAKNEAIRENGALNSLREFLLPLLMNGQVGFKEAT